MVDFIVLAEGREKMKETENEDKYLDVSREF